MEKTKFNFSIKLLTEIAGIFLLIFLVCFRCQSDQNKNKYRAHGTAPYFTMQTLDGKIINSSDLKGKIILLDFWDTHCGPCIQLMPHMEKLYMKYKDNPDVVIFIVNAGWQSIDEAKSFVSKHNYELPFAYMTKQESRKLKVREIPKTIIIDKQFNYRLQHVGYDGYDPDKDLGPVTEFKKLIEILLAE